MTMTMTTTFKIVFLHHRSQPRDVLQRRTVLIHLIHLAAVQARNALSYPAPFLVEPPAVSPAQNPALLHLVEHPAVSRAQNPAANPAVSPAQNPALLHLVEPPAVSQVRNPAVDPAFNRVRNPAEAVERFLP